jgi:hypothetical protein
MSSSRRMKWTGHVLYMTKNMPVGIWCGYLKERDHMENLSIDRSIILKRFLKAIEWQDGD